MKTIRMYLAMLLCAVPVSAQNAEPAPGEHGPDDWAADLDRLVREVEYRHPNPEFFGPPWEEFVARANRLRDELREYPGWRIPWEFSRLIATLSDGHTWVDPFDPEVTGHMTPLRFGFYEDGLYVIGTDANDTEALRWRVVRIGALTPDELLDRARALRLTSADNEMSLRWWTAWHLSMPSALAMLGAIDEPGSVEYELEASDGDRRTLALDAVQSRPHWALLRNVDGSIRSVDGHSPTYSIETHADAKALYWRYDGFREDKDLPWIEFCTDSFETFERAGLERLILDLRGNGGGDPDYGIPLLRGILRQAQLDEPNALIVLIGPSTDSAAVSFCALLEKYADPLFVGMPTFLRPNGHSNAYEVTLPRTGLGARISTCFWRAGEPQDRRPWIVPHVAVPVRFEDIRARRDVALGLALAGTRAVPPEPFEPTLRKGRAIEDLSEALIAWRKPARNRWADVEGDINGLGYQLMNNGQLKDAIDVFELNCRLHPHASNVYDSYGEALLKSGNKKGALRAYRESVRRRADNVPAIEIILDLEDQLSRD